MLFRETAALYLKNHRAYVNNFQQNSKCLLFNLKIYVFATRILNVTMPIPGN